MRITSHCITLTITLLIPIKGQTETIVSPSYFAELWDSGNKFRLMREQARTLKSNSPTTLSLDYYDTPSDFKQKHSAERSRLSGYRFMAISNYFFIDSGVLNLTETGNTTQSSSEDFSRTYIGIKYNNLNFGINGGLLITETPGITSNKMAFTDKYDISSSPFLNISLLGANLQITDLSEENIYVETSSYSYKKSNYVINIERSKIHSKETITRNYDDEYILELSYYEKYIIHNKIASYTANIQRRLTNNDHSQGWSLHLENKNLKFNIHTFDKQNKIRQKRLGGGIEAGIKVNTIDKNIDIYISVGIHINDGSYKIFEVPDEIMLGTSIKVLNSK